MRKTAKVLGIIGNIGYTIWICCYIRIFTDQIQLDFYRLSVKSGGGFEKVFIGFDGDNAAAIIILVIYSAFMLISSASCIVSFIFLFKKKNPRRRTLLAPVILLAISVQLFFIIPRSGYRLSLFMFFRFFGPDFMGSSVSLTWALDYLWVFDCLMFVWIAFVAFYHIYNIKVISKKISEPANIDL